MILDILKQLMPFAKAALLSFSLISLSYFFLRKKPYFFLKKEKKLKISIHKKALECLVTKYLEKDVVFLPVSCYLCKWSKNKLWISLAIPYVAPKQRKTFEKSIHQKLQLFLKKIFNKNVKIVFFNISFHRTKHYF